jgi:hypothetical protein
MYRNSSLFNRRHFLGAGLLSLAALPAWTQGQESFPGGEITRSGGLTAKLIDPTKRYNHAVLGDSIEAGGFSIISNGRKHVYRLGEDAVFEDRRVRLWDVDGDGQPEAVIIKTYLNRGAALAVYKLGENGITPMAETAAIGTRNRWLNPIGFDNFTGSGERLIAVVITPHITGSLRLYRFSGNALSEVARLDGYTNHIIGSRDLDLAHVVRGKDGPQIMIPTVDRKSLAFISFRGGSATILGLTALPARITGLKAVQGKAVEVILENGQAMKISFE